jgi:hypothetical protein
MTMLQIAGGVLAAVLVAGFFGGLIYLLLFKAQDSNYPGAARGIGIALLAGALKVLLIVLADHVSPAFNADWLNYALIAMVAVGMLMMMAGFGGGSK